MKGNLKYVFCIIGICLLIVVIGLILYTGNADKFNTYKDAHTYTTEDFFEDAGSGVWIDKDITNKNDAQLVADKFKEYGLTGSIVYYDLEIAGEGGAPKWVESNNYSEWYIISTREGIFCAIVNDGVVYTNYEEATTNESNTN